MSPAVVVNENPALLADPARAGWKMELNIPCPDCGYLLTVLGRCQAIHEKEVRCPNCEHKARVIIDATAASGFERRTVITVMPQSGEALSLDGHPGASQIRHAIAATPCCGWLTRFIMGRGTTFGCHCGAVLTQTMRAEDRVVVTYTFTYRYSAE